MKFLKLLALAVVTYFMIVLFIKFMFGLLSLMMIFIVLMVCLYIGWRILQS